MVGVELRGDAAGAGLGRGETHLGERQRGAEAAFGARVDGALAAHPRLHHQAIAADPDQRLAVRGVLRREARHADEGVAGEREQRGGDAVAEGRALRRIAERAREHHPRARREHEDHRADPGVARRRGARPDAVPVADDGAIALGAHGDARQRDHVERLAERLRRLTGDERHVLAAALQGHAEERRELGGDAARDLGRGLGHALLADQDPLSRAALLRSLERDPHGHVRALALAAGGVAAVLLALVDLHPRGATHHAVAAAVEGRPHLAGAAHDPDPDRIDRRRLEAIRVRSVLAHGAHDQAAAILHRVERAPRGARIEDEVDDALAVRAAQQGDGGLDVFRECHARVLPRSRGEVKSAGR